MPKAGVEPARGKAPLDFESSASASSATSAEGITGNGIGTVAGRSSRRHNGAPTRAARAGVSPCPLEHIPSRRMLATGSVESKVGRTRRRS